jgi:hypothetical protein
LLNDEDLAFGEDDPDDVIEPQNLLPVLDNTTNTSAVPIRSMVTPRRQNEPGTSSAGSQVGSLVEMMVANMMERQQSEVRWQEEQRRQQEEQRRDHEERYRRECEEREYRREERRAEQEERRREQEECRLDRMQQQQQTMMMMMAFGAMTKNQGGVGLVQAPPEGGQGENLLE